MTLYICSKITTKTLSLPIKEHWLMIHVIFCVLCIYMYFYDGHLACTVCCVLQWWLCPWGVCGCVSLPLQSGGRAGTEKSPATDSAAATAATKGTTPTVSTCCHSYASMCSRNIIYSISSTSCENWPCFVPLATWPLLYSLVQSLTPFPPPDVQTWPCELMWSCCPMPHTHVQPCSVPYSNCSH